MGPHSKMRAMVLEDGAKHIYDHYIEGRSENMEDVD